MCIENWDKNYICWQVEGGGEIWIAILSNVKPEENILHFLHPSLKAFFLARCVMKNKFLFVNIVVAGYLQKSRPKSNQLHLCHLL